MERKSQVRWQALPETLRLLALVSVVVIVSFLFPEQQQFKYRYEKHDTWQYDDLKAPFAFPILKKAEDINAEQQEALDNTEVILLRDTTVVSVRLERFFADFDEQLANPPAQMADLQRRPNVYRQAGERIIQELYSRGVFETSDTLNELPASQFVVILNGKKLKENTLGNLYSPAQAIEKANVLVDETSLPDRSFLLVLLQEWPPNLQFDEAETTLRRQNALAAISDFRGKFSQGKTIVSKGEPIDEDIYQHLLSYEKAYEQRGTSDQRVTFLYAGYLLLTILVVVLLAMYMRKFSPLVYSRPPRLVFILMWLILFGGLVYLVERAENLSVYLIPFCIVPIIIKTFYDDRLAFFTHITVVLMAGYLSSIGFEFTFLQVMAGMVVITSPLDTRNWSSFFSALFFVFLTYALGYLGLSLIREQSLNDIEWIVYSWLILNTVLTLLAYPLIPLLERIFGFVSPITLVELMDMNRPLLRDLSLKAPGTFQHSLQVSNLAEAAARRIGADTLLIRVAALYHDIGKLKQPNFFIENQNGVNPHQELTPLASAEIIIQHVADGVKMAKKAGLPPLLINFIITHHGTLRVEYFYHKYLEAHPDAPPSIEEAFRYPGPKPTTKEEAILMLADSIEAAGKSLNHPTEAELYELIDKIIAGKIKHQQLQHSNLSFRELEECRLAFRQTMKSMHHVRVAYPEEEE